MQGPAAGGKRPPADPPDTKSDSAKAKPHDSEADDDQVASTSDEDLNDFLDSLGNK